VLITACERVILNFEPPSQSVNEAKLAKNLNGCDGMVAVLTWRASGPSPYILYEIGLARRARKPVAVFLDERLPLDLLPSQIPQRRFSDFRHFRQVREQIDALQALKSAIGDPPAIFDQPKMRNCGLLGLNILDARSRSFVYRFVEERGYQLVDLDRASTTSGLPFERNPGVADLALALICVDSRLSQAADWTAALKASSVPSITITTDPEYGSKEAIPREFRPRRANFSGASSLEEVLTTEFDLYEQDFLGVSDVSAIERYTNLLMQSGALAGRYEAHTARQFRQWIPGAEQKVILPDPVQHDAIIKRTLREVEDLLALSYDQVIPDDRIVGLVRGLIGEPEIQHAMERGADTAPCFLFRAVNRVLSDQPQPNLAFEKLLALSVNNPQLLTWWKRPPAARS